MTDKKTPEQIAEEHADFLAAWTHEVAFLSFLHGYKHGKEVKTNAKHN